MFQVKGGVRHGQSFGVAPDLARGVRHLSTLSAMQARGAAVRVSGLRKSYGTHEALRGIDFEIGAGEVFGLLGPNGAGKTTTIELLEGYRDRDGGEVEVLGEDPRRAGRAWRERIGIVLQSCRLDPYL